MVHHLSVSICFGIDIDYEIPWADIAKEGGFEDPLEIEALLYVCTGCRLSERADNFDRRDYFEVLKHFESQWPFEIITYGSTLGDTGSILAALNSETRFSLQNTKCFSIEDLIRSIGKSNRVAGWINSFGTFSEALNIEPSKRDPVWMLSGKVI